MLYDSFYLKDNTTVPLIMQMEKILINTKSYDVKMRYGFHTYFKGKLMHPFKSI